MAIDPYEYQEPRPATFPAVKPQSEYTEALEDQKSALEPLYNVLHRQYARLLGEVLGVLDMSLPNKQQHAAATHQVRKLFDATYFQMLYLTYPGQSFAAAEDAYAVEPIR